MADEATKVAQDAAKKAIGPVKKLAEDAYVVAVADGALAAALLRTFPIAKQKQIVLAAINGLEKSLEDPDGEKAGVPEAIDLLRKRNKTILA